MKSLVIYDSVFGNTEKVAIAIGSVLKAKVVNVKDVKLGDLDGIEVLVVGSPTRAFSPTPAIKKFLKSIPAGKLEGVKVAAFDTRARVEKAPKFLKFLAGIFGYAAEPIVKIMAKKGGKSIVEPTGFFVMDTEGPLEDGELRRAEEWARNIN